MEKKKFSVNLDDSAFTKERIPVKPLFKPSSVGADGIRSAECVSQPVPSSAGQSLSYAEFIIQSKQAAAQHSAPPPVEPSVGLGYGGRDSGASGDPHGGAAKGGSPNCEPSPPQEEVPQAGVEPGAEPGGGQRSEVGLISATKLLGSGNSIIVSPRQRGNPILKFVRTVPWEFGEVLPDYVLGQTTCALFLSLRYHNLNPNYIHDRLKQLGQSFMLRVLLVQVDVKDPHHALKELARICIMADCTLILAWSPEEAGRYLETYKAYEKKPADLLKEHVEKDFLSKVTDCLTTVKSVNKTDAMTLMSTFSTMEGIINASKEELTLCPGLGPQKARRLHDVFHQPFLKSRKKAES
ncbi:hypothetical protein AGOR_G00057820 [Albula goreensis]|uniref:DNA excision repair protein ERCC-1 n=1 Tax=Albula goreensis TaxID=1534307 RepID=A0A8T3DQZ3_9TELE|nr:hypothetical protein AGOR_G00057820 [Albula goreensis]